MQQMCRPAYPSTATNKGKHVYTDPSNLEENSWTKALFKA